MNKAKVAELNETPIELKGCPFCGSPAVYCCIRSEKRGDWDVIECENDDCKVEITTLRFGGDLTEDELIQKWNTRPTEDELRSHARAGEISFEKLTGEVKNLRAASEWKPIKSADDLPPQNGVYGVTLRDFDNGDLHVVEAFFSSGKWYQDEDLDLEIEGAILAWVPKFTPAPYQEADETE